MEVVTADGTRLHVDSERHRDLFWALRGGGGNCGVVTRLQYRLHELDTFWVALLVLPASPEMPRSFVAAATTRRMSSRRSRSSHGSRRCRSCHPNITVAGADGATAYAVISSRSAGPRSAAGARDALRAYALHRRAASGRPSIRALITALQEAARTLTSRPVR